MKLTDARNIILSKGKVCDHCLGRQFRNKFREHPNDRVGCSIRKAKTDADAEKNLGKKQKPKLLKTCVFCGGLFSEKGKFEKLLKAESAKHDFQTYLVGCKIDRKLVEREEKLWEEIGAEFCEPLKKEVNRTFGVMVWNWTAKSAEFNFPDVIFTLDFKRGKIDTTLNPLFIYGRYRKLVRGIPQTKWPCRECGGRGCKKCGNTGKQYKETVEELIAEKAIEMTGGRHSSFHGEGREDIDARMLGTGRPFVLEIDTPAHRSIDLEKLTGKINDFTSGKVEVSDLRFSNKREVQQIKAAKHEKTYEATVDCKNINQEDLKKLEAYFHDKVISQQTPERVLHRRADKVRNRKVFSVKCTKEKGGFRAEIMTEAGAYIKELVSGDNGRTEPSFTSLLGKQCLVTELDVTKIGE